MPAEVDYSVDREIREDGDSALLERDRDGNWRMSAVRLLRNLAEQHQFSELRELCRSLWDESGDPDVLPLLALARYRLGEWALAEQCLELALSRQTEYGVDARVDLAGALISGGRLDAAVEILEGTLVSHPRHALALARLGDCRMLRDEPDAARELYERVLDLEPDRVAVAINLIDIEYRQSRQVRAQQRLDAAFAALLRHVAEWPELLTQRYALQLRGQQFQVWIACERFGAAEEWLREQFLQQQEGNLDEDVFVGYLESYASLLAQRNLHPQAQELLWNYRKSYPANSTLVGQLAELCSLQGHRLQAVNLLRRALAGNEGDHALWIQYGNVCLQHQIDDARRAAEKAVELAEALRATDEQPSAVVEFKQAQAKNLLARVESQEQNFERAEQLFGDVLADNARFAPALQGLAQQYLQLGRIDEAVALLERLQRLDPVQGAASLINARRFPEDPGVLEKLERAARLPSLEGDVRSSILFQLATAWEKEGDYDRAFVLAREANEANSRLLAYDAPEHRNVCARIRHGFCRELYEHRPDCGVDSTLPVYVVGMPRSGTTLVEQIIAGHSRIFGAGELGVIPRVAQGLDRWERHVGSGRRYPDCADDLTPRVVEGIAADILEELGELAPEAAYIVDKLPHNFENIGLIKFLFPNAKIISLRRDPRDIAISNYFADYQAKHGGMGFAYDLEDIGEQLADHNLLMHHWHQVFPGEILELRYEDVVEDVEGAARRMLDYIGVDWEPQVLDFNTLDRPVKTASVWQVRQPVYTSSRGKWRHYEKYLAPLIQGTNRPIRPDEIVMLTLPEPGFLTNGVELYQRGDLDGAELSFKKMLHHNPDHAACNYMVGLVYMSKGHEREGVALLEKAVQAVPWQREWREKLIQAYCQVGDDDKAAQLEAGGRHRAVKGDDSDRDSALGDEIEGFPSATLGRARRVG